MAKQAMIGESLMLVKISVPTLFLEVREHFPTGVSIISSNSEARASTSTQLVRAVQQQSMLLVPACGLVDTAVAGGLNVITDPDNYAGLGNGHFLSKTGQCKVWDKDADGYCRADGVASIIIKRLEDAVADNDNIIATILSGATNHSAEAVSITHPHAGAQKENYRQVMQDAGVNPLDVSYVVSKS